MLVCSVCGESISETARFCQSCGAPVREPTQQLRKTITALFCDLVGSTQLADSLADPEAVHDVLTRYLRAMSAIVERNGGTIEKFAGDAILATFGVPVAHEDDALRACRTAIGMQEALSELNSEIEARWDVTLQLRIGINTGVVVAGGSIAGHQLTLGDPMNVAARLQQSADPGEILLAGSTLRLVGDGVRVDSPRSLRLKGKSERVRAHRLTAVMPETARRFKRPMVGRASELTALRRAYERVVRAEKAEFVVLVGSPGVGKSRLVTAFVDELEDTATVYTARCPPHGERASFWPIAEIVRSHAGVYPSDEAEAIRSKIARAVDAVVDERGERVWITGRLASLVGVAPPEDTAVDRADSFAAWRRLLEVEASRRPLVLVFEDLHWTDDALLDFLASLAGSTARIFMVGTARPDLDEKLLVERYATVLRLEPLAPDEVGGLIEATSRQRLPRDLIAELVARAGGNPLFAEALVAMVEERGLERDVMDVPDRIEALVAARLDALSHALRSLVLDAAVIGSSIRAEALASMGGSDPQTLQRHVDDLVEREFLRPRAAPNEFDFWHELVRDVAYGQIPRASRSKKHAAYAEWLEGRNGEPDLLTHHYGRAFELAVEARESDDVRRHLAERTLRCTVPAAARALRAADPATAATLLSHAGDALKELPAPDLDTVGEAGRLLVSLGRWSDAVALLDRFAQSDHVTIHRELGVAICKLHRDDPHGADYRWGQALLERAAAHADADAIASLAGTWKGLDEGRVRELYRRASEIDPADPYPLGNLLEYEIQAAGDLSPVEKMRDRIVDAIERCREQSARGENIPWALYDLGKFTILLGRPWDGLDVYARAVDLSAAAFMVETSLASLERLATVVDAEPGLTWARRLLALALPAKFGKRQATDGPVPPAVVILAGGTSSPGEESDALRTQLLEAFEDITATVISGGTVQGVSGLAGDVGERYPDAVHTIGYRPRSLPQDAAPDPRYDEVRTTTGDTFSPIEPVTYWEDLLRAGISPTRVRMIGIGGGRVASAEYSIGLGLGATLGVIRGSGRAADDILADAHWSSSKRLVPLTHDAVSIRSFLEGQETRER